MMRAIVLHVGAKPVVKGVTKDEIIDTIGGLVRVVYLDRAASLVCNDDGRAKELPTNRIIGEHHVRGPALIIGRGPGGRFEPLTDEALRTWLGCVASEPDRSLN